jgi:hypothetical protein
MFRYSAFGLTIDSELELPAPVCPPGVEGADVTIRLGEVLADRKGASIVEEFLSPRAVGRLHIRRGREIFVEPAPGANLRVLRNIVLGRAMALLLRQRGWLPLHASGVVINGQGVLFAGPSGEGKSTTAAAFHAHGFLVIADDVAAVRGGEPGCEVQPAWSHLRLLDDSRAVLEASEKPTEFHVDKHRFNLAKSALRESFPLRRIYILESGRSLDISVIPALSAVAVLSANTMNGGWMEPELIARHLRDCASIASAMPVHRLIRPRELSILPNLVRLVEDDARSGN